MLIVSDKMIVDMISNKKINQVVTEVFIRGKALNISAVSVALSYFTVLKNQTKLHTSFCHENPETNERFKKPYLIIH